MFSIDRASLAGTLVLCVCCVSCGSSEDNDDESSGCQVGDSKGCDEGLVCEVVEGGDPACFEPIRLEGTVTDASSGAPVEGAIVVARDANGAAVSGTATTDADGEYSLVVPVSRDTEGRPLGGEVSLRADASSYQTFPSAPRIALPIELDSAVDGLIQSSMTDIVLIPMADATATCTISGRVDSPEPKGALVVAGGATALVDSDGSFTLFNVPAGDITVVGYQQGKNYEPVTVSLDAGDVENDVVLDLSGRATHQISGKVEVVNPGDGTTTSVILVVEDTFVENAARGEVPPGLRVADVSGEFVIEGVPDGRYVVLAAFENDYLVRDPDVCIGGTEVVHIEVAGKDMALDQSFKVTGALGVVEPDGEQTVTGTPNLVWADDSSEDHYEVAVYDTFGNLVWEDKNVPSVSGKANVSVAYGGEPLESGMIYQFRATSIKKGDCPISRTEDLRGVFRYE